MVLNEDGLIIEYGESHKEKGGKSLDKNGILG